MVNINYKSVTILDFTTGEVHCYQYPDDVEDLEVWLMANTVYTEYNSQFMSADSLKLTIHGI